MLTLKITGKGEPRLTARLIHMTKVIIFNDQELTIKKYRALLETDEDIQVVGCAGNINDLDALCERTIPDVIISQHPTGSSNLSDRLKRIKEQYRHIKIIYHQNTGNFNPISTILDSGIDIFLTKEVKSDTFLFIVKHTMKSVLIIEHKSTKAFPGDTTLVKELPYNDPIKWTDNERSILKLVALGKSNKEIASVIHLCEGRVKNIITGIMKKLGFNCRAQIAVYVTKSNLLYTNEPTQSSLLI